MKKVATTVGIGCAWACVAMAQDGLSPAAQPTSRPSAVPVIVPARATPAGTWAPAKADELERLHDAFFAEPDTARRKALYEKNPITSRDGLTLEDLEQIARVETPDGKGSREAIRVQCPWMKDNSRGWFIFGLPAGYTPKKSWGLIIVMHGSHTDGDNLPPFYTPQLNNLGFFVLYPTTTVKDGYWGQRDEMINLFREIDWVARRYRIDFRRISLTGGSMGGCGTWSLLMARPELWNAGAPVAGYPVLNGFDFNTLEPIRGTPFYMLHGEKDQSEGTRRLAAEFQRRKIDVTYVEAPGSGHTPPDQYWSDLCVWLAKQPAKPWSPRPLFLPAAPSRPLWQVYQDPLRLGDDSDATLAMIRVGPLAKARQAVRAPSVQATPPDMRVYLLRALASVPGLLDPYPFDLQPNNFAAGRGWTDVAETAALENVSYAIRAKSGGDGAQQVVEAELRLLAAKIWAKRFGSLVDAGGVAWVTPYNNCIRELRVCLSFQTWPPEVLKLVQATQARLPVKSTSPGTGATKRR